MRESLTSVEFKAVCRKCSPKVVWISLFISLRTVRTWRTFDFRVFSFGGFGFIDCARVRAGFRDIKFRYKSSPRLISRPDRTNAAFDGAMAIQLMRAWWSEYLLAKHKRFCLMRWPNTNGIQTTRKWIESNSMQLYKVEMRTKLI